MDPTLNHGEVPSLVKLAAQRVDPTHYNRLRELPQEALEEIVKEASLIQVTSTAMVDRNPDGTFWARITLTASLKGEIIWVILNHVSAAVLGDWQDLLNGFQQDQYQREEGDLIFNINGDRVIIEEYGGAGASKMAVSVSRTIGVNYVLYVIGVIEALQRMV